MSLATAKPLPKPRRAIYGNDPLIFSDIYEDDVNIAIWHRDLPESLKQSVRNLLTENPSFQTSMTVSPESISKSLGEVLGSEHQELTENISELTDMFCCLFDLSRAGLRMNVLHKAMCPRFHVDVVPCRLLTTFQGIATEWLPNDVVDRSKLGRGNMGLPDNESGIYQQAGDVQQLNSGDVALLKGENWFDNEGGGLVHRSPAITDDNPRLLLTLDFAD